MSFLTWRTVALAAALLLAPLGAAGPAQPAVAQAPVVSVHSQIVIEPSGVGIVNRGVEVLLTRFPGGDPVSFGLVVTPGSAVGAAAFDSFGHAVTECPAGADFLFGQPNSNNAGGSFTSVNPTQILVLFPLCADNTPEADETFTVQLCCASQTVSIDPTPATITIVDDDTPPQITVGSVRSSEGTRKTGGITQFGTTPFEFPVTLSRRFGHTITVPYTLADKTAHRALSCGLPFSSADDRDDFTGVPAQSLVIPAGDTEATITVPVCADTFNEPDESFVVGLSTPSAGTLAGTLVTGTIVNDDLGSGTFRLAPRSLSVRAGDEFRYRLSWTVPSPEAWRALRTVDLRLADKRSTAIWLRWTEATNAFRLVGPAGRPVGKEGRPGKPLRLPGRLGTLELETSSVVGRPHSRNVTLTLGLELQKASAGRTFRVEAAATDDLGHSDAFRQAGTLSVKQ